MSAKAKPWEREVKEEEAYEVDGLVADVLEGDGRHLLY